MNICFMSGEARLGAGGVADYTRLMAQKCQQMGHKTFIIGINDQIIENTCEESVDGILLLHISKQISWSMRWLIANEFKTKNNVDWISLQFVPYAFDQKGLFKEFLKGIKGFVCGTNCHIIFHEIWIGEYPNAKLKERLIGKLQKRMLLKLIDYTKPKVVNYTNAGAKIRLESNGVKCSYLPIFSNIPVIKKTDKSWIIKTLVESNKSVTSRMLDGFIFYGLFGTLHDGWPARQLLERLRMYTSAQGKSPALLHAGFLPKNKNRWKEIKKKYTGDWFVHSFGELPKSEISNYLHGINFGLTSTPWDLIGKSGTIAAMIEHGIPVIVNSMGGSKGAPLIVQEKFRSLIIKADEHLLLNLKKYKNMEPVTDNIDKISEKFIAMLKQCN